MFDLRRVLSLTVVMLIMAFAAQCQELKVAAAADLSPAMEKLAPAFQNETGIHVSLSLGSSGNFFSQIENGAPFDVFMSADKGYALNLERDGKATPGSLTLYARGKLVVWMPDGSKIHLSSGAGHLLSGNLDVLAGPQARKVAIANPAHAPYGRAAMQALQHYGIYERIKSRLVLGENISQTAQFAQSGNADVGLIALSLAVSDAMQKSGHYVLLPQNSYAPLDQAAVVLQSSQQKEAAKRFLEFLKAPVARQIFQQFGFEVPQP